MKKTMMRKNHTAIQYDCNSQSHSDSDSDSDANYKYSKKEKKVITLGMIRKTTQATTNIIPV